MANGLFGNAQDVARAAVTQDRLRKAQLLGGLGPGGHGALAGLMAGSGISGLLGGTNPIVSQQLRLQQIGQEMEAAGLQPGTPGFSRQVFARMLRAGFSQQESLGAFMQAQKAEQQAAEISNLRAQAPDPRSVERRAIALMQLGQQAGRPLDFAVAMEIASDPKAFAQSVARLRTEPTRSAQAQLFADVQTTPGLKEFVENMRRLGAQNVTIQNFHTKPLGKDAGTFVMPDGSAADPRDTPADAVAKGGRVLTQAELTAVKKRAQDQAALQTTVKELNDAIGNMQRVTSQMTGASVLSPSARDRYNAAARRVAKAVAQTRNPPAAEASQEAEEAAFANLPGIERALTTNSLQAILDDLRVEAQSRLDQTGGDMLDEDLNMLRRLFPGAQIERVR